MTSSPLHLPPEEPVLGDGGQLANPLGVEPFLGLDNTTPIAYDCLKPSTTYTDGRFEYLTDGHGMPARIRGLLRLVPKVERARHARAQRRLGDLPDKLGRRLHGGHFVAVSLGGCASGPNLFPQEANFNLSAYKRLENGWRQALIEGCEVAVDVAITEDDGSYVPTFVVVTYWEDGEEWTIPFINDARAQ